MVALSGPGFVLALFQQGVLIDRLTIIGLVASPSALSELRGRIAEGKGPERAQSSGAVEVLDPMGITWQISDDDQSLSNGGTTGRWVKV